MYLFCRHWPRCHALPPAVSPVSQAAAGPGAGSRPVPVSCPCWQPPEAPVPSILASAGTVVALQSLAFGPPAHWHPAGPVTLPRGARSRLPVGKAPGAGLSSCSAAPQSCHQAACSSPRQLAALPVPAPDLKVGTQEVEVGRGCNREPGPEGRVSSREGGGRGVRVRERAVPGGGRRGNDAPSWLKTSVYFDCRTSLALFFLPGALRLRWGSGRGACKKREGGVAGGNVGLEVEFAAWTRIQGSRGLGGGLGSRARQGGEMGGQHLGLPDLCFHPAPLPGLVRCLL